MPTELSEDIWREIVTFSPKDTRDVVPQYIHDLSLTNRRLRQIALPTLYRSLTFSISNYHTESDPTHMHETMVNLIRLHARAKALYNSPHLLKLVRELTLQQWSTSPPDGAYWGMVHMVSQDMVDAVPKMAVAICDSLSGLVSRIPDLRDLSMTTRMTPDLYKRICSSTPLISLRVHVTNLPVTNMQEDISRIPADHQKMSHIRHLRYLIIRDNFAAERNFVHILKDCLLKLETLEIQSTQLMLVNSLISNGPISLQSLRVSYHYGQPVHDSILWDLLRACPKLRFLTIIGAMPEIFPLDPGIHVLPSLAKISSVPSHVRALTMGKQMEVIDITRAFRLSEYSLTDIVRSSKTHLHTLNITVTLETLQEFLQFLHSLCQFENLVNFRASYHGPITPGSGSLSLQDLRFKVWDSLRHLTRLRIFKINNDTTHSFVNTEFGCLIGAECDPNDRGHPSLELLWIGFLSHYWLVWVHEEGWIRRDEYTVRGQRVPNAGGMPSWLQPPIKWG